MMGKDARYVITKYMEQMNTGLAKSQWQQTQRQKKRGLVLKETVAASVRSTTTNGWFMSGVDKVIWLP